MDSLYRDNVIDAFQVILPISPYKVLIVTFLVDFPRQEDTLHVDLIDKAELRSEGTIVLLVINKALTLVIVVFKEIELFLIRFPKTTGLKLLVWILIRIIVIDAKVVLKGLASCWLWIVWKWWDIYASHKTTFAFVVKLLIRFALDYLRYLIISPFELIRFVMFVGISPLLVDH